MAVKIIQKFKAEVNIAVAAASIVARITWEEKIDDASKDFNLDLRKINTNAS